MLVPVSTAKSSRGPEVVVADGVGVIVRVVVGENVGVGDGVNAGAGVGLGEGVGVNSTHKTDTVSVMIVCSPDELVRRRATVLSTGSLSGGPDR